LWVELHVSNSHPNPSSHSCRYCDLCKRKK
jgi:hypothetical protein